jgi:hypothetical protein
VIEEVSDASSDEAGPNGMRSAVLRSARSAAYRWNAWAAGSRRSSGQLRAVPTQSRLEYREPDEVATSATATITQLPTRYQMTGGDA